MFGTRKQLHALQTELQHTRLIVDRLRRDVNRAQSQLRALNGWGDDFIKTREISEADTRVFLREQLATAEPTLESPLVEPAGELSDAAPESRPAESTIRRRLA
jgi:hypothetical protein